ncbi:Phosphotyrosyl phosphatase activator [Pluteus cervinus]|uniref:Phosphotyrosyl phosphatase activator n=1 Tax=Pluteus cervinus TaxID=181527 RepID=A0ACD3ABP7_9AGAR|nr:Phosphotyrosyl phosphatase activator [Pluteus cervinus]
MATQLHPLRQLEIRGSQDTYGLPRDVIRSEADVQSWKHKRSYQDYALFLRRLNEAVVGCSLPWTDDNRSEPISKTITMIETLDGWIDEIPPLQTAQRFGNLAFRSWGKRLEERADDLLKALLPTQYHSAIPYIKPYLERSFGSFTRMDYGTGHETAFALFLLCLTLIRFYQPVPEEERNLVLIVFLRYLQLCWRLQDVYRLEPAGSHGVWGLDDSSFLGYIFGSGQLRDQTGIPVSAVLQPSLPDTNLYFLSIKRIHQVKTGPFHEHSSQLHSIAVGVPNWNKVNTGLFKMYEAEVLGKRVVVQHIPLGGLLEWDCDIPSASAMPSSRLPLEGRTSAPWASSLPALVPRYGLADPSNSTSFPSSTARGSSSASTGTPPAQSRRNTSAGQKATSPSSMAPPPLSQS